MDDISGNSYNYTAQYFIFNTPPQNSFGTNVNSSAQMEMQIFFTNTSSTIILSIPFNTANSTWATSTSVGYTADFANMPANVIYFIIINNKFMVGRSKPNFYFE